MSIQYTAESALHLLEELYRAIDLSSQQQSPMSIDDSENLVQTLCHLSQLINHINQTGMCEHTPTHLDANQFNRKKMKTFITPHLNNYDENIYKDSVSIEPPHFQQSYDECVLYHPIRIITTDKPIVLHENDFGKRERQYRKEHNYHKHFLHHKHPKTHQRRMSKSHDRRSKSSRSRSRGSRLSRQSRRSSHGRISQSHDRSLRSSRRSSRSSRREHRRAHSRGRKSRSSQRGSRRSRSSQRRSRSRRRSSHKRRSTDRQYFDRQIPSRPVSTTTTPNPTTPSLPSNQMGSTSVTNQSSSQQLHIRSLFSSAPSTTTNTTPTFTPTIPLPPPPITSALHHSHPLNDQSLSFQQVPISANIQQQQQPTSLLSPNPLLNNSTQNDTLSSSIPPLQTTTNTFTSRSDNCPECRAITRLLQWAPLKCYDAAGIQRGVFLAGPKSEQLLKALYSSIQDSAFSFDDIEDCLCDNE